jgi:hypothetical protein
MEFERTLQNWKVKDISKSNLKGMSKIKMENKL